MTKEEVIKLAAVGTVGVLVGDWIGTFRANMRMRRWKQQKQKAVANDDMLIELKAWLDNPADTRNFNTVMDEWFVNHRFKKIMNQEF